MMPVVIDRNGQTVRVVSKSESVAVRSPSYSVSVVSGIISGSMPYEGAYEVVPSESVQVLSTEGLMMRGDVTIGAIPSNYGLITYDGVSITVS